MGRIKPRVQGRKPAFGISQYAFGLGCFAGGEIHVLRVDPGFIFGVLGLHPRAVKVQVEVVYLSIQGLSQR